MKMANMKFNWSALSKCNKQRCNILLRVSQNWTILPLPFKKSQPGRYGLLKLLFPGRATTSMANLQKCWSAISKYIKQLGLLFSSRAERS